MDQAAPAHQGILWHHVQCCQHPTVDRLATFVLVAIAKKELKLDGSLYSILQILSVTLFQKTR